MATTLDIPKDIHESLRTLRFKKAGSNSAVIYKINKAKLVVEVDQSVDFDTLEDLVDDLPSNAPRYIIVSYDLAHPDGRRSNPLFMLDFNPGSAAPELKTLHASALSAFQLAADVARVIEIRDEEDLTTQAIEGQLLG